MTVAPHLISLTAEITYMFQVVGVPVTINGDLKNQFVEANVGFDTTCKVTLKFSSFFFLLLTRFCSQHYFISLISLLRLITFYPVI